MRLVSSTMFLLFHFPLLLSLSLTPLHVDFLLCRALSVTEAQHKLCSKAFCSVINIKMRIYCFSGKFDMSFVLSKLRREQKGKRRRVTECESIESDRSLFGAFRLLPRCTLGFNICSILCYMNSIRCIK